MWLFSEKGFVSIVQTTNTGFLTVRARVKGDIEKMFPGVKVIVTPSADYRFRAEVSRGTVAAVLENLALKIDYDNFKNRVAKHDPNRAHTAYMDVWKAMLDLQSERAKKPKKRKSK